MSMKKIVIGLLLLPFCFHSYSMDPAISTQQKSEAKYFFHQQINDMCMIAPMLNLRLLELMKNPDGSYDLNKVASYSRREWMALNILPLLKWHGIIESLNHPAGKKTFPSLVEFVENAKKYGPVFPHFYDENGSSLIDSGISKAFSGTLQVPYFLIDYEAVKRFHFTIFGWPVFSMGDLAASLGLFLPVFKDKHEDQFQIPFVTGKSPHQKVIFYHNDLSDPFVGPGNLGLDNLQDVSIVKAHFLGLDSVLKVNSTARGYLSPEIQSPSLVGSYVTFSLGLYKLMLLTLGITDTARSYSDVSKEEGSLFQEKNQIETIEKKLSENVSHVVQNIQHYVAQDGDHPWNSSYFNKNSFLQHAIAQLLIADKDLYEEAKAVTDFYFPVWGTYDKYLTQIAAGDCFNAEKNRYYACLVKQFLPSEEYVLSYALAQDAWYLAIGGINSEAFYKALTNDTGALRSVSLGIKWSVYKNSAYAKKWVATTNRSVSYMDVWKKITQKLSEKYGNKNWISFSGHGTIFSFDNDILQKQGAMKNEDPAVLKDLGFAVIDSWLGTELNTFYKK